MLLAFILVTVVAVAEETIFRGYLILRFRAVTGRTSAAVLLSSIVFSLGHGYEGMAGVISVFSLGWFWLWFACGARVWSRRLSCTSSPIS